MKNGVSSDESPNSRSASLRPSSRRAVLWKAKPAPRSTMPSAARLSGMNSVEKIASNAVENAVHSTTSTKISQTWLASQTGPIAQSTSSRARRPRSPRPATRLQNPAPKSAPPKHGVRGHADPEHPRDGVGAAHGATVSTGTSAAGP